MEWLGGSLLLTTADASPPRRPHTTPLAVAAPHACIVVSSALCLSLCVPMLQPLTASWVGGCCSLMLAPYCTCSPHRIMHASWLQSILGCHVFP